MRLVYLPGARRDLAWLRHYYEQDFPEGAAAARTRIRAVEKLLAQNPFAGRPVHPTVHPSGVRRLVIPRTPFFVLYRVRDEHIEVLRLPDGRSFDSMLFE